MLQKVRNYIQDQHMILPGDGVIVALSGGADSVCLLVVLACTVGTAVSKYRSGETGD